MKLSPDFQADLPSCFVSRLTESESLQDPRKAFIPGMSKLILLTLSGASKVDLN